MRLGLEYSRASQRYGGRSRVVRQAQAHHPLARAQSAAWRYNFTRLLQLDTRGPHRCPKPCPTWPAMLLKKAVGRTME